MNIDLFHYHQISLDFLGLTGKFWTVNLDTLIYTWIAMGLLVILAIIGKAILKKEPTKASLLYEQFISFFIQLCNDSFGSFHYRYFAFVATLFLFTLMACLVGLIPYVEEATQDLNTTLALGLTSFIYVQYQKIRVRGILSFFKEFAQPFVVLAPINIVGEFAKIASMSFRLFGNILGGSIIFSMLVQFIGSYKEFFLGYAVFIILASLILSKIPAIGERPMVKKVLNAGIVMLFLVTWTQFFFGIFEGLIQSFVLTMLTITYLSMGVAHPEDDEPESPVEITAKEPS